MSHPFELALVQDAVRAGRLRWQLHALERLAGRNLSTDQVKQAILSGEVIE
jgi:hypothetical protein